MAHIEGASRVPHGLFPEVLDDDMAEEKPGRFIAALVDRLDLDAFGFRRPPPAATGRPSSAPGDFLTLYIDGDMNRLRSSRRLEKATPRNVELLWLLRTRHPDFKPIADFRNDKAQAFTQVFRALALRCQAWELFGPELGASDGTTFKAVNSQRRNFTNAKRTETLPRSDAPIAQDLPDLDTADAEEAEGQKTTAEARREKIRQLRERKGREEGLMRELERPGQSPVSLTAPDSRARPKSPNVEVGYNAQVAGADQPKLVVVHEVTKAVTDVDQRRGLAIQGKAAVEVEQINVVAAMGDDHGEAITACEEAGMEPYVAKPLTSANRHLGR
jgi:transposase